MVQGLQEIAAMLVGLVGLIGAAASTGMPMWKVTAFIGENIIVMETRWEGLWMNCYRQANIRMQCKVYDSLLFLPPDLQAARGLMCCSLALSGLGLLVATAGMRCVSCVRGNERAKVIILMAGGGMQFAASACVFIPVSWTGHVIIRDFYNPLLIDAQRRELGEALYIGWMTGAFLFASGCLFTCRRLPEDKDGAYPRAAGYLPDRPYHQQGYNMGGLGGYGGAVVNPLMGYQPVSSVSSLTTGPLSMQQPPPGLLPDNRMTPFHPNGVFYPAASAVPLGAPGYPPGSLEPSPETSVYTSHPSTQLLLPLSHHPSASGSSSSYYHSSQYAAKHGIITPTPTHHLQQQHLQQQHLQQHHLQQQHLQHHLQQQHLQNQLPSSSSYTGSSFHPVPQNPIFIRYHKSRVEPDSYSGTSRAAVYI